MPKFCLTIPPLDIELDSDTVVDAFSVPPTDSGLLELFYDEVQRDESHLLEAICKTIVDRKCKLEILDRSDLTPDLFEDNDNVEDKS